MSARNNPYITNWLAAYCGDEQTLFPQAVQRNKEQVPIEDKNLWPLIDTASEKQRLERLLYQGFFGNLAPGDKTSNRSTAISSKTVRAIVEPVSNIHFCMRGYLVDLSTERKFAMRVIEFQRDYALLPQGSDDDLGDYPGIFARGDDATPAYAGIAYPRSRYYVGEIHFSDFACFELNGFLTNLDEEGWRDGFLKDLQNIIELISP
jgi:hypothetical protein